MTIAASSESLRAVEPAGLAEQRLDHPLDHLHDVLLALAQVGVLDLVELGDQLIHLLHQRPLGIAATLGNDLARHLAQHRVGQDHHVQVDECADFRRHTDMGACLEARQFPAHESDRLVEARHLGLHLPGRHRVVRDFQRGVRNQLDPPDGDAR